MTAELLRRPAVELAAMIRRRELSARELTQASLDRIAAVDPQINAFTHVAAEQALAEADAVDARAPADPDDAPFAGVPIAIKDNCAVAGMPTTWGSRAFGDFTARHDMLLVARLRQAGFVVVGKTALSEFAILPTCESARHGPTANPWALDRTPGGSSGGSAAAVAAGMVPIAHGNDGGGSIRIPAACCGLVGLKPARGRVSSGPDQGHSFLACNGVLTHDVRDSAAVLDVIAGYEPGDASWAPPPAAPFVDALELAGDPPRPLRIGLSLEPPLEGPGVDPQCTAAARDAARLLSELGHEVEEVDVPWTGLNLLELFSAAFGPLCGSLVAVAGQLLGRPPAAADVEALSWEMYQLGRRQDTLSYLDAQNALERVGRGLVSFMLDYDAILTPALGSPPVPTGEIHGRGPDPLDHFERSGHFTPYTAIVNVTGQPAIALPLFTDASGLPLGVQLIGPPAGEDVLLGLAAQLEAARPWAGRVPDDPRAR